jgi:Tol biopolymer transport system component
VTTGVLALYGRPQFSRDGQRMVFQARVASVNPVMIPFDPATLKAGAPVILDGRNNIRVPSAVSPDDSMLAYFTIGERQEDILIGPVEGSMRRLTDDAPRDRAPTFTADGKSLLFYSTRDGAWGLWSIGVDGGNLHKVPGAPAFSIYPVLSPKGDTVALTAEDSAAYLLSLVSPSAVAVRMPGDQLGDLGFSPSNWSPDGARIVGRLAGSGGRSSGIGVYDVAAKTLTSVSNDRTPWVMWLSDSRRVIYFTHDGHELAVLDTVTKTRTTADVRLPAPSVDDMFAMSPDRRRIFYGAARSETDIWVVERK